MGAKQAGNTAVDVLAATVFGVVAYYFVRRWSTGALFRRNALGAKFHEGRILGVLVKTDTAWPVLKTVGFLFVVFWGCFIAGLLIFTDFRWFHGVLAAIGAWFLAWLLFVFVEFKHVQLADGSEGKTPLTSHTPGTPGMRAKICPQNLAIQEVDLVSTLISAISVLVSVVAWLRDSTLDASGDFWTSTTVWPTRHARHGNYSANYSLPSATGAVQAALATTCANSSAVLHVVNRTWNDTVYSSFDISTASTSGEGFGIVLDWWYELLKLDQWYAIMWILMASLVFQCERASKNKVLPYVCPGREYDPEAPDVTRWAEYALTSPVQVFLVAVNVGKRQDELLWMLIASQAMLMYLGYLVELCLHLTNDTTHSGASPGASPAEVMQADYTRQYNSSLIQYMPVDAMRIGCGQAVAPERPSHVGRGRLAIFNFIGTAFWWHFLLWRILIDGFRRSEAQFNTCQHQEVPEWIQWLLYLQFAMFTLFGVVQLAMAVRMTRNNAREVWREGSMCYSVLSLTAKLTLDVLFIAGAAMRE